MNDFTAWREATPKHNELVDTILGSSCHIVATLRTKTAYEVIQEDEKKGKVAKIGLAFVQREGLEYEFTVVMDLSVDGHVASSTKDRMQLYDGRYFTPNEETGRELLAWLNQGDDPRQDAMGKIDSMLTTLDLSALRSNYWLYALNRYQASSVELLTEHQFQEQIALLSQCRQSTAKSSQLRDILQNVGVRGDNIEFHS